MHTDDKSIIWVAITPSFPLIHYLVSPLQRKGVPWLSSLWFSSKAGMPASYPPDQSCYSCHSHSWTSTSNWPSWMCRKNRIDWDQKVLAVCTHWFISYSLNPLCGRWRTADLLKFCLWRGERVEIVQPLCILQPRHQWLWCIWWGRAWVMVLDSIVRRCRACFCLEDQWLYCYQNHTLWWLHLMRVVHFRVWDRDGQYFCDVCLWVH
jgi:hypothetical protein